MITTEHTQEQLSRAYVIAIAALAGVNLSIREREQDYGVDGTFLPVTTVKNIKGRNEIAETGYAVDFQLKSSVNCTQTGTDIKYDCKAKDYNKLVNRNGLLGTNSCLLLVLCLPASQKDWLTLTGTGLTVGGVCYWFYLTGTPTTKQKRITIPRTQRFTPETLQGIITRVQKGEKP